MSRPYRQTDFEKETENFEAFDQLTTALTLIDKYQSSDDKNTKLLDQAAESIKEALKADENYFKARYFQAVVNYLRGTLSDENAVDQFSRLLNSEPAGYVITEIKYNLAVAKSDRGYLYDAIKEFQAVIDSPADPETKLLARAGLALTHAKRIEDPEYKNAGTQDIDRKGIDTQSAEIKKTLASPEGRLINEGVVKEVNRIMNQALKEKVKLPRWRRKLARVLRRHRLILLLVGVLIILLVVIPYLYLYYGLNDVIGR